MAVLMPSALLLIHVTPVSSSLSSYVWTAKCRVCPDSHSRALTAVFARAPTNFPARRGGGAPAYPPPPLVCRRLTLQHVPAADRNMVCRYVPHCSARHVAAAQAAIVLAVGVGPAARPLSGFCFTLSSAGRIICRMGVLYHLVRWMWCLLSCRRVGQQAGLFAFQWRVWLPAPRAVAAKGCCAVGM